MFEEIKLNELNLFISQDIDLFICCNSFEERCCSIPSSIPLEKITNALILTNSTPLENSEKNLKYLSSLFSKNGTVIPLDYTSPIGMADSIIEKLSYYNLEDDNKLIFVDVTTFTHELLLILFAILNEYYSNVHVLCGYNNAKDYSYKDQEIQSKWLSRGIGEIRSVLGYPGNFKLSQDNLLMVIVGYEYERAARIIDVFSPDQLSLGYNEENNATTDINRDANVGYARLVKDFAAYFEKTIDFVVPSNNPFAAFEAIQAKLDTLIDKTNVTIVPMNNKLSTMGVALVGLSNPDIRVCYAPALVYNTSSYSQPGDKCYLFSFVFPSAKSKEKGDCCDESNQSIV